jgi:hypothetical protein
MNSPLRLLPPRVPLVDPKTGYMSRDWYMFFQQLYDRVGGATGPSTTELASDLLDDGGAAGLAAQIFTAVDEYRQQPSTPLPLIAGDQSNEVAGLREQVATLATQLNGAQSAICQLSSQVSVLLKELDALNQTIIQP